MGTDLSCDGFGVIPNGIGSNICQKGMTGRTEIVDFKTMQFKMLTSYEIAIQITLL